MARRSGIRPDIRRTEPPQGGGLFPPVLPRLRNGSRAGIPPSILEFVFDTTRAISSLLYSGTLSRCLDIKFIFSHGGGTAPFLADRIASLVRRPNYPELRERIPKGVDYELGKLYYDVVSIAGNPPGFQALKGDRGQLPHPVRHRLSLLPHRARGRRIGQMRSDRGRSGGDQPPECSRAFPPFRYS